MGSNRQDVGHLVSKCQRSGTVADKNLPVENPYQLQRENAEVIEDDFLDSVRFVNPKAYQTNVNNL